MEIPGPSPESSSNLLCGLSRVISYSLSHFFIGACKQCLLASQGHCKKEDSGGQKKKKKKKRNRYCHDLLSSSDLQQEEKQGGIGKPSTDIAKTKDLLL